MSAPRKVVLVVLTGLLMVPLTGCSKEFCDERTLLGFVFCDPDLVKDPAVGPSVKLVVHPFKGSIVTGETLGFSAEIEGAGSPFYPAGYASREEWDLDGDGTYEVKLEQGVGTRRKVFKSWDRPGVKTVRLRVTDLEDNATEQSHTIKVTAKPSPETSPRPSFTISPNPALPGEEVRFDATGSADPDGQIVEYFFSVRTSEAFGVGGPVATHTFSTADRGSFKVELAVTDNDGLRETLTLPMTVALEGPFDPVASFTATHHPTRPREVLFDASSSSDRDGTIERYSWDLDGDGRYEIEGGPASFSTTYASDGQYHVSLAVTDNDRRTNIYTQRVDVFTRHTEVSLSATPNPSWPDEPVQFEARVLTPGRTGEYHKWDLYDDGVWHREGASPFMTWSYNSANVGTFPVTVQVTDNFGMATTTSIDLTVLESRPPTPSGLRAAGSRRPPARRFFARLDTRAFSARSARTRRGSRGTRGASGLRAAGTVRGELLADRRTAGPRGPAAPAALAAVLDAKWVTHADFASLLRGRRQTVSAIALATPRRGRTGRACLRISVKRRGKSAPTGSYEVLGGTGQAARLRARGRFGLELRRAGKAALAGTVTASTGKARRLPRACRALAR